MKGRAAKWIEPYVKDFLKDADNLGTKSETQGIFGNWDNFKKEIEAAGLTQKVVYLDRKDQYKFAVQQGQ